METAVDLLDRKTIRSKEQLLFAFMKSIVTGVVDSVMNDIHEETVLHKMHQDHCNSHTSNTRVSLAALLSPDGFHPTPQKEQPKSSSSSSYLNSLTSLPLKILDKHERYNAFQIEVVKQRDPYSCGYHSFHNAYLVLKGW